MPIRREGRSRFAQTHCDGQMRSKYPLSGPSDTSPSVRQQPIPAGPTRKKKPPIKRARVKKKRRWRRNSQRRVAPRHEFDYQNKKKQKGKREATGSHKRPLEHTRQSRLASQANFITIECHSTSKNGAIKSHFTLILRSEPKKVAIDY